MSSARPGASGGRRISLPGRDVITHGVPRRVWQDLYHSFLMKVSWPWLFASFALFFTAFNLAFGLLYRLDPGAVANLNPRGYWGDVFFSIETLATVGYGDMHPDTLYGHVLASLEVLIGLSSLALFTGAIFARFSRPTARFLFARHAVIRPFDGRPTLMLRAANGRQSMVMEASAQLRLIRDEVTVEGYRIRRIYDLALVRREHPAFVLGWTLLHIIGADSPLAAQSAESLRATNAYLMLTIGGFDQTTSQLMMARHIYSAEALLWGYTFSDVLRTDERGVDHFDYSKFNDVEPLQAGGEAGSRSGAGTATR